MFIGNVKLLSKSAAKYYSCGVASKRAGLQPYLISSKVNLTMHLPHVGLQEESACNRHF